MELSFSELRAKEVINTQDGKRLGRVCDIVLCYPENRWIGLVVPSGRGFGKKTELFIELRNIVKIGEDVILINIGVPRQPNGFKRGNDMPPTPPRGGAGNPYGIGGVGDSGNVGRNYEEFE